MNFADSVAAMMAVHQLMEQMKALYQQVSVALAEIPDPFRETAIRDVIAMSAQWEAEVRKPSPAPIGAGKKSGDPLPSATQAIFRLLAESEEGLTAEQIQTELKGRFQTNADKPERVITSTLSQLRANSKLLHEDGRYSLPQNEEAAGEKDKATLKQRVIDYFRANENQPATTLTLAKATGSHPNKIRSLFSTNAKTFSIVPGSDPKPNTMKLWKLRDDLHDLTKMLTGDET